MKKLMLLIGLLLAIAPSVFSQDMSEEWGKANTLYINGDYIGAAREYEAIASAGYISGRLFYNLGNAYFKAGELGKSILNYNKAQLLAPYDNDTEYNLFVANGYVKDRIESVPEFFIIRWLRGWRASLDSNAWAVVSLAMLALALGSTLLFLLADRRGWRKTGFFSGLAFACLFILSAVFSAVEKRELRAASQAIVMTESVAVKSSPERGGSDIFILHEGTKVNILSSYDEWSEVSISDGNKGWLPRSAIELIVY